MNHKRLKSTGLQFGLVFFGERKVTKKLVVKCWRNCHQLFFCYNNCNTCFHLKVFSSEQGFQVLFCINKRQRAKNLDILIMSVRLLLEDTRSLSRPVVLNPNHSTAIIFASFSKKLPKNTSCTFY